MAENEGDGEYRFGGILAQLAPDTPRLAALSVGHSRSLLMAPEHCFCIYPTDSRGVVSLTVERKASIPGSTSSSAVVSLHCLSLTCGACSS